MDNAVARRALLLAGVAAAAMVAGSEEADAIIYSNYIGIFNVKDVAYGAVGDGVHDDTTNIQAAINAAATAGASVFGGIVYFPPGRYLVSQQLVNNNASTYVQLHGSGKHATTIIGNVYPGYIINQDWQFNTGYITCIRDMFVQNSATPATLNQAVDASYGAVKMNYPDGLIIHVDTGGNGNGIVGIAESTLRTSATSAAGSTTLTFTSLPSWLASGAGNGMNVADVTAINTSQTVTFAGAVFTATGSNFSVNQPVTFTTTGTIPTNLALFTTYYVISTGLTANAFEVAASPGGTAITPSGGTGTLSVVAPGVIPPGTTVSNSTTTTVTLSNPINTAGVGNNDLIVFSIVGNNQNATFVSCNCSGNGGGHVSGQLGYGSVGIAVGQAALIGCSALAFWVGIATNTTGTILLGTRTETCDMGLRIGYDPSGARQKSAGCSIIGHTTERCYWSCFLDSCSEVNIESCSFAATNTAPPNQVLVTPTVTGAGPFTVTVTSSVPLGWSGTRSLALDSFSSSGPGNINTGSTTVTSCTATSTTTFTFSIASNPGTFTATSGVYGNWNFMPNTGIKTNNVTDVMVNSTSCNAAYENAGVDMSLAGSTLFAVSFNNTQVTVSSPGISSTPWIFPTGAQASAVICSNCLSNTNSGATITGVLPTMLFANLPGQTGVTVQPTEGMVFDITDCNASTFLATAAGGGSTQTAHRRVRYNAALPGWQVIG